MEKVATGNERSFPVVPYSSLSHLTPRAARYRPQWRRKSLGSVFACLALEMPITWMRLYRSAPSADARDAGLELDGLVLVPVKSSSGRTVTPCSAHPMQLARFTEVEGGARSI